MDLSKIKNGQKIVLGAGLLLIINLFLPWYRVDLGAFGSANFSAWHFFLAWFGSFLAIAAFTSWIACGRLFRFRFS